MRILWNGCSLYIYVENYLYTYLYNKIAYNPFELKKMSMLI